MDELVNRWPYINFIFKWIDETPAIGILFWLMLLDIVSGLLAAFIKKRVSSTVSWQGMSKKGFVWIFIGAAAVIDSLTPDIPESRIVAIFFCMQEFLSIIENAAEAGVPLPPALTETLARLKVASSSDVKPFVIQKEKETIHIIDSTSHKQSERNSDSGVTTTTDTTTTRESSVKG